MTEAKYALFRNGEQVAPNRDTWWEALCDAHDRNLVEPVNATTFKLKPFVSVYSIAPEGEL